MSEKLTKNTEAKELDEKELETVAGGEGDPDVGQSMMYKSLGKTCPTA